MIPYRRSQPKASVTLDIIPSVPAIELFGPPDPNTLYTIRGILRITLTKPLTIKQITVKFKGFTQNDRFRFSSLPGALGGRGARTADDIFILIERAEKIIEDTPRTLPPGTTEIPFDLTFVADIPPSCVLSRGCIRYALSARVNPDSLLYFLSSGGIRTSVPVTVRRNMLRNLELAPYAPTVRYRGRRPGRIEYEFEVPKTVCLEQRKLEFSGKVSALYDAARVKKILVRMDQMEVFRSVWSIELTSWPQWSVCSQS
ncbi:hypothetical protein BC937DRAFT_86731 [Endogone sp. FLAS-F59071]|nr:hypothetical protein BC937DRAFT_86731 [Endogone sp. FLAS-F59071]|eukprot:RUS12907.1 hypothetical protein BC937DRAFT_86731 [Endogone sp. FLAS-F59071]